MGAVLENDTFPVESGTLRLTTLLPPCSLSSSGGPGFLAVGSQEEKKKKKKRKKRKPLLPKLGRVPLGDLWGGGSGWQTLSRLALARSLLLSLRVPGWWPGVEVNKRDLGLPTQDPCLAPPEPLAWHITVRWGSPALDSVTSSPGRGDVLKREPNLGGLHQRRSIPNKIVKQTGKKSPIKPHA